MKKIAALCALPFLLAGCEKGPRAVKIAMALPLTGDVASLGQGIRRAARLAIEEARTAGRLPAGGVEVIEFDDRSDPKEAVNVANRIVSDPSVVAIIGHFNSGCSIPASRVYAQAGLPMMNAGSSNPELTRQQLSPQWRWPRVVFRANTTDDAQGTFAGELVFAKLKKKTAVVVHDKTAYGQGIAEEFQKSFTALGGRALAFDGVQPGDKDFKALLTRLKGLKPEAIFYGGTFTEGALLLRQARELGFACPFVTGENSYDPDFIAIAGPGGEGAYVTYLGRPADLLPSAKIFVDKFQARYPGEPIRAYDHYGYEIANILIAALEKVGPDRGKIIGALQGLTYEGVLGTTTFDEKGDTLNKTISVFVVRKGQFVPAEF
jgi:branched-chain amino acid transport system substrate-binding protein